jgi:hypothetical protein
MRLQPGLSAKAGRWIGHPGPALSFHALAFHDFHTSSLCSAGIGASSEGATSRFVPFPEMAGQ